MSTNATDPEYFWLPRRDIGTYLQIVVNLTGILGNAIMVFILNKRSMGGKLPTMFFLSQAWIDLFVCLQSLILSAQPKDWGVNVYAIDLFICRVWHSQLTYWFSVQLSIGNLVLIGFERYFALAKPMIYQNWRPNWVGFITLSINTLYNVIMALPNSLETTMDGPKCKPHTGGENGKQILYYYAIVWFIGIYLIALILLIFFYAGVIKALRKSAYMIQGDNRFQAKNQFTRIAILITIVYFVCITYDAVFYLLGRTNLIRYEYHTFEHQLGVFLVSLNSFANPVIYFGFVVRNSFVEWLKNWRNHKSNKTPVIKRRQNRSALLNSESASSSQKNLNLIENGKSLNDLDNLKITFV